MIVSFHLHYAPLADTQPPPVPCGVFARCFRPHAGSSSWMKGGELETGCYLRTTYRLIV